ncbi:serine/threonine-protein kinase KIN2 [Gonapodya sp. JEL0774]|nr:serine/threonine-protein kinase KIN2 [Gonapodya sp. JEL0774]
MLLLHHPHIASLLSFASDGSNFYLFFEHVDGAQLLDFIIGHGRLREKQARRFVRMVGGGIDYCHRNSIVHRDLKIENILVDRTGDVKIIDFGLANLYEEGGVLRTFCGSLYFAAPELLSGTPYTGPEVDIWALGVVLYVLVCGKVPFDDADMGVLHAKIKEGVVEYPGYLSGDCKHLLSRLLVVDPANRATMEELLSHPWMLRGYDGPPSSFVPPRMPLTKDGLDVRVLRRMTGFGWGGISEVKKEMERALEKGGGAVLSVYHLVREKMDRDGDGEGEVKESSGRTVEEGRPDEGGQGRKPPDPQPMPSNLVCATVHGDSTVDAVPATPFLVQTASELGRRWSGRWVENGNGASVDQESDGRLVRVEDVGVSSRDLCERNRGGGEQVEVLGVHSEGSSAGSRPRSISAGPVMLLGETSVCAPEFGGGSDAVMDGAIDAPLEKSYVRGSGTLPGALVGSDKGSASISHSQMADVSTGLSPLGAGAGFSVSASRRLSVSMGGGLGPAAATPRHGRGDAPPVSSFESDLDMDVQKGSVREHADTAGWMVGSLGLGMRDKLLPRESRVAISSPALQMETAIPRSPVLSTTGTARQDDILSQERLVQVDISQVSEGTIASNPAVGGERSSRPAAVAWHQRKPGRSRSVHLAGLSGRHQRVPSVDRSTVMEEVSGRLQDRQGDLDGADSRAVPRLQVRKHTNRHPSLSLATRPNVLGVQMAGAPYPSPVGEIGSDARLRRTATERSHYHNETGRARSGAARPKSATIEELKIENLRWIQTDTPLGKEIHHIFPYSATSEQPFSRLAFSSVAGMATLPVSRNPTTPSSASGLWMPGSDSNPRADEHILPVDLKGLFSVSNTTNQPPSAIRARLIEVLHRNGFRYVEMWGGFECEYLPSINFAVGGGAGQGSTIRGTADAAAMVKRLSSLSSAAVAPSPSGPNDSTNAAFWSKTTSFSGGPGASTVDSASEIASRMEESFLSSGLVSPSNFMGSLQGLPGSSVKRLSGLAWTPGNLSSAISSALTKLPAAVKPSFDPATLESDPARTPVRAAESDLSRREPTVLVEASVDSGPLSGKYIFLESPERANISLSTSRKDSGASDPDKSRLQQIIICPTTKSVVESDSAKDAAGSVPPQNTSSVVATWSRPPEPSRSPPGTGGAHSAFSILGASEAAAMVAAIESAVENAVRSTPLSAAPTPVLLSTFLDKTSEERLSRRDSVGGLEKVGTKDEVTVEFVAPKLVGDGSFALDSNTGRLGPGTKVASSGNSLSKSYPLPPLPLNSVDGSIGESVDGITEACQEDMSTESFAQTTKQTEESSDAKPCLGDNYSSLSHALLTESLITRSSSKSHTQRSSLLTGLESPGLPPLSTLLPTPPTASQHQPPSALTQAFSSLASFFGGGAPGTPINSSTPKPPPHLPTVHTTGTTAIVSTVALPNFPTVTPQPAGSHNTPQTANSQLSHDNIPTQNRSFSVRFEISIRPSANSDYFNLDSAGLSSGPSDDSLEAKNSSPGSQENISLLSHAQNSPNSNSVLSDEKFEVISMSATPEETEQRTDAGQRADGDRNYRQSQERSVNGPEPLSILIPNLPLSPRAPIVVTHYQPPPEPPTPLRPPKDLSKLVKATADPLEMDGDIIKLMDSSGKTVLDSVSADYEDCFTIECLGDLIRAHLLTDPKGTRNFIIARVQTWDHKQPDKAFYSYYDAFQLNKVLFQTQVYLGKKLIHRLHVLNPLTNTDIIGNVQYFMVRLSEEQEREILGQDEDSQDDDPRISRTRPSLKMTPVPELSEAEASYKLRETGRPSEGGLKTSAEAISPSAPSKKRTSRKPHNYVLALRARL